MKLRLLRRADPLHAMFAWTFYLLSQNPDVERRLLEEVDALSMPPSVEVVPGLDSRVGY